LPPAIVRFIPNMGGCVPGDTKDMKKMSCALVEDSPTSTTPSQFQTALDQLVKPSAPDLLFSQDFAERRLKSTES